jgi:uncharacterized protein DUF4160
MPTVSSFYGVTIHMYWDDHTPPHFHAKYGGAKASIDIRTLAVIRGMLPPRALALTLEWATAHRDELMENWELCAQKHPPKRIRPLR